MNKSSLPCSQQPASGTYPQPNESSPHTSFFSKILLILVSGIYLDSGLHFRFFLPVFSLIVYRAEVKPRSQWNDLLWWWLHVPLLPLWQKQHSPSQSRVKLGSTQSQSGSSDDDKVSPACRQSIPPTGWVLYPVGGVYHPRERFTNLQEEFTTLGKGSLPCRRSLQPSGTVH